MRLPTMVPELRRTLATTALFAGFLWQSSLPAQSSRSASEASQTAAHPESATSATSPGQLSAIRSAVADARAALLGLEPLWGANPESIRWIFTDGSTHLATSNRGGRDTLVSMELPAGTMFANTAVTVDGQRWAMVLLPLRGSAAERSRLLIHEAIHTLQPGPIPGGGNTEPADGGDLLDGGIARRWLFLELRALADALESTGDSPIEAAWDALTFRAQRDHLATDTERTRLRTLDIVEGLAEYTAWRLTDGADSLLLHTLRTANALPISWVRSVAYYTGPAYGLLLDRLAAPRWRNRLADSGADALGLPELLTETLGREVAARAARYDGADLERAEAARTDARRHVLDSMRQRFLTGPVLRIAPKSLQLTFDPNGQVPLGADGTVMGNLRWVSEDGAELTAPAGALVSPDWSYLQVPLDDARLSTGALAAPLTVSGGGWRLMLPAGWVVSALENGWVVQTAPQRDELHPR